IDLLDVGSGEGSVIELVSKNDKIHSITSLEISDSGIHKIKSKEIQKLNEIIRFDGYVIPLDKKFNVATCSHVIEHVEHPRILLREIARVSEYQIFEIPIDFSFMVDKKVDYYLGYGHINIYTPSLFKFLLKSEGYEILFEDFIFYNKPSLKYRYQNEMFKY